MATNNAATNVHQPASRRNFLKCSAGWAAVTGLSSQQLYTAEALKQSRPRFRAAIIGHTGHGDYGHEHELIFNGRDDVEVVAVADPDPGGRTQAAQRCQAQRSYADYREMIEKETPQLVCVTPRWTDQHHAMASAALRQGAHVYSEKPFTQTLAEADDLLAQADKGGLKIVVAHQMRLGPGILHLQKALETGLIGELLEIRAQGKQDGRAGGEDMIVLGTHLFDLIRFFAGDPAWCTARILQSGREVTLQDVRKATENIGPVIGDEIHAHFAMAKGVNVTFISRSRYRETAGPWSLELVGSKGSVKILMNIFPDVYLLKSSEWTAAGQTREWRPLPNDPTQSIPAEERRFQQANQRVLNDWLEAIQGNREPVCSGRAAMKAIEMALAVFQAGLTRERVALPLARRSHPLQP